MGQPKRGSFVTFTPSERTNKKFENQKNDYPALITEVNENSVDLTVFGVGEFQFVTRVQHSSLAVEGRSKYDFIED
ncbi:MAG: hypothetical protein ACK518_04355 [bacterium]|jgi:hypothetical protein